MYLIVSTHEYFSKRKMLRKLPLVYQRRLLQLNNKWSGDFIHYSYAENVSVIELDRPKSLNALSDGVLFEIQDALKESQQDSQIGSIILTGRGRAFAAGADIKAMLPMTYGECGLITSSLTHLISRPSEAGKFKTLGLGHNAIRLICFSSIL